MKERKWKKAQTRTNAVIKLKKLRSVCELTQFQIREMYLVITASFQIPTSFFSNLHPQILQTKLGECRDFDTHKILNQAQPKQN